MKELYKKYINWIVIILLVLLCGKSCQSCSAERRLDWDAIKYENIIDSINSENHNLNKRIIGLEDSIKMYKYKLDIMNDREKELIESNNHLRTSNKNLLQTAINLSDKDKTNEK